MPLYLFCSHPDSLWVRLKTSSRLNEFSVTELVIPVAFVVSSFGLEGPLIVYR